MHYDELVRACRDGSYDDVCRLLETPGVDPSVNGSVALAKACKYGHIDVVQLLLADGRADPAGVACPLSYACYSGHIDVVKAMLADPRTNPSEDDNCPLRWAGMSNHTNVVEALLADPRVNVIDVWDNGALLAACMHDAMDAFQMLLADPRINPNCAIPYASVFGKDDYMVLLLADARVKPIAAVNYAMCQASRNRDLETVRQLLHVFDPDVDDNAALRWAVDLGHVDVVRVLLESPRADVRHVLWQGRRNAEVLRALLQHPTVNSVSCNGALVQACSDGEVETARLVLAHPCAGHVNDALEYAIDNEHGALIRLLLTHQRALSRWYAA